MGRCGAKSVRAEPREGGGGASPFPSAFAGRNRRGWRAGEVACPVAARADTPPASPLSPERPH